MSEYQYYEFVALDRPLSEKEMDELRAISTRAEITPTRFRNEYNWGDLKADPAKLLARYFDAHLYFANWGTPRFMLRLPAAQVDLRALRPYFPGGSATLTRVGRHVVLDLCVTDEVFLEDGWHEGEQLDTLTPLRASLLQGDWALAYVAWLLTVQMGELDDDVLEPPVPPGLRRPSAPLSALVAFLCIDPDLLQAAAEASPAHDVDAAGLEKWVKELPDDEKERWLVRAIEAPEQPLGTALLAAYRRQTAPPLEKGSRTVGELCARVDEIEKAREKAEARRAASARARAEAARRKYLDELARQGDEAWARLEALIENRKYDEAVQLTVDLHDAAAQADAQAQLDSRFADIKKRYARRRSYMSRVKRALSSQPEK